jgi:hypothetical protein
MCITTLGCFKKLIDNMVRSGLIRIPHSDIDDILAASPGFGFQLIDDIEHIRRKPINSLKIFHSSLDSCKYRPQQRSLNKEPA